MGYSTKFKGELQFTKELTASQLAHIQAMVHQDCREHPEWGEPSLYYIDLELTRDFTGLKWDGSEKTYHLDRLVNVVIREMRKKWPDFGLSGSLNAQGEDFADRWTLTIGEDGFAHHVDVPIVGQRIECPHCGEEFVLEEK